MRSDLFYWVLNMSIFGGLLCLIVLVLRRIPWFPRFFVYGLWALPLVRLICPVGLTGRYNLMGQLVRLGVRRVPASWILGEWAGEAQYLSGANGTLLASSYSPLTMMNYTQIARSYSPIVYEGQEGNALLLPAMQKFVVTESFPLQKVMETAALIWLIVAVCLILGALLLYRFSLSEGRLAEEAQGYYVSDRVKVPAVYGIFRCRIVLPSHVRQEDIPYILLHERVHLQRRDNLWRCLAVLVCCVHWFNPICWLSLRCFFADMELACDAAAVHIMTSEQRKAYAHAVLNTAQDSSLFASAFGGAKVSLRIRNLLSYRKLTAFSTVAFALLFAVVAYVLVTN